MVDKGKILKGDVNDAFLFGDDRGNRSHGNVYTSRSLGSHGNTY